MGLGCPGRDEVETWALQGGCHVRGWVSRPGGQASCLGPGPPCSSSWWGWEWTKALGRKS